MLGDSLPRILRLPTAVLTSLALLAVPNYGLDRFVNFNGSK